MRTCEGCAAEYPDERPYCPECGLGAGARRPDVATHVPAAVAFEESVAERSGRWTRTAVTSVVAVLLVLTGTLVGVVLARGPGSDGGNPAASTDIPVVTVAPNSVASTVSSPTSPSSPKASATPLVQVAPAIADKPRVHDVIGLLTRYFQAINQKDHGAWESTLVPRTTGLNWDGLRTTTDLHITVSAVDTSVAPVRAAVSFISHQDAALGNGSACTNWSIVYPLSEYAGGLRIDVVGQQIISQQPCRP